MAEFLTVEVDRGVALVTLNRPKMNALSRALQEEIRDAAHAVSQDKSVKAVVFYGGKRTFAAGADIKEMREMSYTDMVDASAMLQSAFTAVADIPKPVIAAITGYALGAGYELALACDFRVCGEGATVGQPEILLGLIPGAGGSQRLPRLVGVSVAKDLIYSGRFVAADEALSLGLVDKVVSDDDVLESALTWARSFVGSAPYALRSAKEAIDKGMEVDVDSGLEIERLHFAGLFATKDRSIGMESFVENGPGKAEFVGE